MLSNLTAEQRNSLQAMPQVLGLAADIAHAAVTIYLPGENKKFFNVYKQEQPMTQVGNVRPDMTGRRVRAVEEPLVARVLQKNVPVNGKREWALGMFNSLKVFPLRDSRGHCYGAVSFESAAPDDIIIAQSLELLCNLRQDVSNNSNYRRLLPSDGIMVVDANRVIVAANNRARHMFDVMDISHLVGCRTNDVAINWPLVGMVMETGTAESKEFTMHGILLSIRILPVIPRPKAGCAIVILQDITELRKRAVNHEKPEYEEAMKVTEEDMTLDFILEERARELFGEWQRRLDLKRFGRLIDQVRIYNPDAKDNIKEYHVVRPIPQTQFDGMPDWTTLGQNEGY